MTEEHRQLKGGTFQNRYLIKATLTAKTPFHIGDGETITRKGMRDEEKNKDHQINSVATDGKGRAYIPGSSLRGALRDWLCLSYDGMTEKLEEARKKMDEIRDDKNKNQQEKDDAIVDFVMKNSSALERIFGTQQNEGKLEVWDAYCTSKVETNIDEYGQLCFWHKDRITYVAKSVAIDPETGTAEEGKLYNFELVPAGAAFEVNFSAQNLSENEPALLIEVLNGFNHPTNPITIGAMTKLDLGKFCISDFKIHHLDSMNIDKWREIAKTTTDIRAGYDIIADSRFEIKKEELKTLNKATLPAPKFVAKNVENWLLNLETPLVIRNGTFAGWNNSAKPKTRNYKMEFKWNATPQEMVTSFAQVGDLYHSLEIKGDKVVPYYHVPSSSIRGSLRAWTIEHLLPKEWWNMEDKIKESDFPNNKPDYLDNIISLFGFAIEGAKKGISKEYTKAGRLTIQVDRFGSNQTSPDVDGADWKGGNDFGPSNAERQIKPRNPLDRITHAAKEGGLHNFLEFSKGQKLSLAIEILKPDKPEQGVFDQKLLEHWKSEINSGEIRFGGLTGIGRGRAKVITRTVIESVKKEAINDKI